MHGLIKACPQHPRVTHHWSANTAPNQPTPNTAAHRATNLITRHFDIPIHCGSVVKLSAEVLPASRLKLVANLVRVPHQDSLPARNVSDPGDGYARNARRHMVPC